MAKTSIAKGACHFDVAGSTIKCHFSVLIRPSGTVIEFLIENDQVQKINEAFIETQTPVIIDTLFTHNEVSSMIVILSQHLSVTVLQGNPLGKK